MSNYKRKQKHKERVKELKEEKIKKERQTKENMLEYGITTNWYNKKL